MKTYEIQFQLMKIYPWVTVYTYKGLFARWRAYHKMHNMMRFPGTWRVYEIQKT